MPKSLSAGVTSTKIEKNFYVAGMMGKGQEWIHLIKNGNRF